MFFGNMFDLLCLMLHCLYYIYYTYDCIAFYSTYFLHCNRFAKVTPLMGYTLKLITSYRPTVFTLYPVLRGAMRHVASFSLQYAAIPRGAARHGIRCERSFKKMFVSNNSYMHVTCYIHMFCSASINCCFWWCFLVICSICYGFVLTMQILYRFCFDVVDMFICYIFVCKIDRTCIASNNEVAILVYRLDVASLCIQCHVQVAFCLCQNFHKRWWEYHILQCSEL